MSRKNDETEIEMKVMKRFREERLRLGLTQQEVAARTGVSYQQIHKYESGTNRLPIGKMIKIAKMLNRPIAWFFEDVETVSF